MTQTFRRMLCAVAERPTTPMNLTYAGQMIVGVLVAGVGASVLAKRST
jgi:hypothetical protein